MVQTLADVMSAIDTLVEAGIVGLTEDHRLVLYPEDGEEVITPRCDEQPADPIFGAMFGTVRAAVERYAFHQNTIDEATDHFDVAAFPEAIAVAVSARDAARGLIREAVAYVAFYGANGETVPLRVSDAAADFLGSLVEYERVESLATLEYAAWSEVAPYEDEVEEAAGDFVDAFLAWAESRRSGDTDVAGDESLDYCDECEGPCQYDADMPF